MVCFFLSLLKQKLPQRCPKRGGGSRPLLDNVQKEAAFFQDYFPNFLLFSDFLLSLISYIFQFSIFYFCVEALKRLGRNVLGVLECHNGLLVASLSSRPELQME